VARAPNPPWRGIVEVGAGSVGVANGYSLASLRRLFDLPSSLGEAKRGGAPPPQPPTGCHKSPTLDPSRPPPGQLAKTVGEPAPLQTRIWIHWRAASIASHKIEVRRSGAMNENDEQMAQTSRPSTRSRGARLLTAETC